MARGLTVVWVVAMLGTVPLTGAEGARIVTMPTARLLSAGSVCISYFWADMETSNPYAPQSMSIAILGVGLTPKLELDATYLRPEGVSGMTSIGMEHLVSPESLRQPAVAVGVEDILQEIDDTAFYLVASKIVTGSPGRSPTYPAVALNLGYSTRTGAGIFGGAQVGLSPRISAAAAWDGHQSIYSLSYRLPSSPLVLMVGTLGDSRWAGARYTARFR